MAHETAAPELPDEMWLNVLQLRPVMEWMRARVNLVGTQLNRVLRDAALWRPEWERQQRDANDNNTEAIAAPTNADWRQLCKTRALGEREQRAALEAVVQRRENVFITGGAGTGKTHVLREVVDALRAHGRQVVVTASTGVAAAAIGGTTLHEFTGVGLAREPLQQLLAKFARRRDAQERWQDIDVLVIDEISMVQPRFFEVVNAIAGNARCPGGTSPFFAHRYQPAFGGLQVVVFGDFFQLAPVGADENPDGEASGAEFCFETLAWRACKFTRITLEHVHRQLDDAFVQLLARVRIGVHTAGDIEALHERVVSRVRGAHAPAVPHMFSHNRDADCVNARELERLPADTQHEFAASVDASPRTAGAPLGAYKSWDGVRASERVRAAGRKLSDRCPAGWTVKLRIGARVMLLANVSVRNGLVNGACGTVVRWETTGRPVVRFADGTEHAVERHAWTTDVVGTGGGGAQWVVRHMQMPLRLAYATTIHKAQGLSMHEAEIKLDGTVFAEGQAYVALSRVRSKDGLRLIMPFDPACIRANPRVLRFYGETGAAGGAPAADAAGVHVPDDDELRAMVRRFVATGSVAAPAAPPTTQGRTRPRSPQPYAECDGASGCKRARNGE